MVYSTLTTLGDASLVEVLGDAGITGLALRSPGMTVFYDYEHPTGRPIVIQADGLEVLSDISLASVQALVAMCQSGAMDLLMALGQERDPGRKPA